MIRIECPRCGRGAVSAVRKVYCPICGWNREEAVQRLQSELGRAPRVLGFLAVTLFLSFMVFGFSWVGLSIITMMAVFSLLVALEYQRLQGALQELLAKPTRSAPKKAGVTIQGRVAAEQRRLTEHNDYVRSLPRPPRRVRMSRELRFLVAIFFLPMGIVLGGFAIHYVGNPHGLTEEPLDLFFLGLPAVLALVGLRVLGTKRRMRRLLVHGEGATGWATKQSDLGTGGRWQGSEIAYEYKDATGRLCQGRSPDATDSVCAGMLVVVMYDPNDLHNSMALCGGPYEMK